MANNGNNGLGEGFKEVLSFGFAEAISVGAAMVSYTFMDDLIPETMKFASKVFSKTCIAPFQDTIERNFERFGSKTYKVDRTKPREERAESYAHYLLRFGISAGICMGTEWASRIGFSHLLKTKEPASNLFVTALDKGINFGGIIVGSTILGRHTNQLIDATSDVLQKTANIRKDHADRIAEAGWRWESWNVLSAVTTCAYLVWRQLSKHGKAP